MLSLLQRRRAMMQQLSASPICPYITNGLIFWLDGINRGGIPGEWKDLIGGKVFTLSNVNELTNGIQFLGVNTSFGEYDGAVSEDWSTETLEIAKSSSNPTGKCFLSPPKLDAGTGIGLIFSSGSSIFCIRIDGTSGIRRASSNNLVTLSANKDYAVANGVVPSQAGNDSWGGNTTGKTYLGIRANKAMAYNGIIYSVRIYNRLLTEDEMKANQAVDVLRFNL